jgi:metal-responsive CopG/Arc/MetJ family transcriptional regulator
MKAKTSITLSEDVLTVVDQRTTGRSRSEFIETALWAYIAQLARNEQNARDLDILNRNADRLNQEAADVLTYQVIP